MMFLITVLAAIMGLIATDIFVPSLPIIAHTFHQTANQTQLTISLFLVGFAISQLFYGPISDRAGRKPPLYIGVLIFIFGSILCIFASSFAWLCIGRIIQGIGVGAGLSLARVILRDRYHGTVLAVRTAQVAIFVSLTPAIAPFIGGILQQQFNFNAIFIFMLVYGLVLLFLLTFWFKETNQHKQSNLTFIAVFSSYKQLLKNSSFIRYAIIAGFAFASIVLYANIVPFIVQDQLKLSAFASGAVMLIAALGVSVGSLISSRAVAFVGPKYLVTIGLFIFAISGLLLMVTFEVFNSTLICLVPLLFLITLACGFIFPNVTALCFSEIHVNIGIAGAIYGTLQIFISMLINLLLNTIHDQDQALLGLFYLIIGFAGLLLVYQQRYLLVKHVE